MFQVGNRVRQKDLGDRSFPTIGTVIAPDSNPNKYTIVRWDNGIIWKYYTEDLFLVASPNDLMKELCSK